MGWGTRDGQMTIEPIMRRSSHEDFGATAGRAACGRHSIQGPRLFAVIRASRRSLEGGVLLTTRFCACPRDEAVSRAARACANRRGYCFALGLFGQKYLVRGIIEGPTGRIASVVSVWVILAGETFPRLVTAYRGDSV